MPEAANRKMRRLDDIWDEMLSEAHRRAIASGNADAAEYLELRLRNDRLRAAAADWLVEIFVEAAAASPLLAGVEIEREEPHQFVHSGTTLTGLSISARLGVRCVTLQAGWPRRPSDGIIRGAALAIGRISHRGLPRLNVDLRLVLDRNRPGWIVVGSDGLPTTVDKEFFGSHFAALVGE
ncbi:MAG: hypothetical protein C4324_08380 [Blastocatellia bacterium]